MADLDFTGMAALVAVAKHRNFKRAAIERGVSRSALSHSIRLLESSLGLRLLNRTTRSVALTEAGERLLARIGPAFGEIERAVDDLNALRDTPTGTIRISAPRPAARLLLAPLLPAFIERYPHLHLEIVDNDALIDIVAAGFDAGIRYGERIEQDMIAVPIGPQQRFSVVAAPSYLEGRKPPAHPLDLRSHSCIRYRFPSGAIYHWEFEKDGETLEVDVDGPLTFGSLDLALRAAVDGLGVAIAYEVEAEPLLHAGRLVRVLEDWTPPFPGFFLYYPSRRHVSAGLRAFIDMARR